MSKQKSRLRRHVALLLLPVLWAVAGGARADCSPQGILWKIDAANAAPSYLLGTMHSDDPRVLKLPRELEEALRSARSFTMEVVMDPQALAQLSQRMMLPTGESLQRMLDTASWKTLVAAMQQRQVPPGALRRMRPWAVAMILSMPQQFSGVALDFHLQERAVRMGKRVYGLESLEEQVGIFDGLSSDEQLLLLRTTLQQLPQMPGLLAQLTNAYLAGDLAAMQALTDAQIAIGDVGFNKRFVTRLVDDRNVKMLQRMQARLREGGAFVAVGALHLPGERGLLCMLRAQGYDVQRVY